MVASGGGGRKRQKQGRQEFGSAALFVVGVSQSAAVDLPPRPPNTATPHYGSDRRGWTQAAGVDASGRIGGGGRYRCIYCLRPSPQLASTTAASATRHRLHRSHRRVGRRLRWSRATEARGVGSDRQLIGSPRPESRLRVIRDRSRRASWEPPPRSSSAITVSTASRDGDWTR